ncbi:MAG: hypothetical protein QM537_08465 [Candidatus Symbiobacter sp.]|nr:hypothetical protein [Candidatus Symbiobacter sp.]
MLAKKLFAKSNRAQREGLAKLTDAWAIGASFGIVYYLSGHLDLTKAEFVELVFGFFLSVVIGFILRKD